MEIRELKYYKWVFDKDKVTLINKKENKHFVLSMPMADSLCRACISFRNRYRIEQGIKGRGLVNKTKASYQKRIEGLKIIIDAIKKRKDDNKINK